MASTPPHYQQDRPSVNLNTSCTSPNSQDSNTTRCVDSAGALPLRAETVGLVLYWSEDHRSRLPSRSAMYVSLHAGQDQRRGSSVKSMWVKKQRRRVTLEGEEREYWIKPGCSEQSATKLISHAGEH